MAEIVYVLVCVCFLLVLSVLKIEVLKLTQGRDIRGGRVQ
jgi:hypothetical protein